MTDAKSLLHALDFRRAALEEIVDLRHRILRAGLPRDTAIFPGDDRPDTIHFAAFNGETAVASATLHVSSWSDAPAWQLRGMAADDGFRGVGLGRILLERLEAEAKTSAPQIHQFWCNARVPASGFYQRLGWTIVSEVFDIPTAGPHVKMTKSERVESSATTV